MYLPSSAAHPPRKTAMYWIVLLLFNYGTAERTEPDNSYLMESTLYNSTLACTRGERKLPHDFDCKNEGSNFLIAVKRLFYGTTPISSGCHWMAPYNNCCYRDPAKPDCVFDSDFQLDEVALKCSGKESCHFYGRSVNSVRGDCNAYKYPDITSFSFVEYGCIDRSRVRDICHPSKTIELSQVSTVYLGSNHRHMDTQCSCGFSTKCGVSLIIEAIVVQLRKVNSTECVEELTFQDRKESSVKKTYACDKYRSVHNQVMFKSKSNSVSMVLDLQARHYSGARMLIKVRSSDGASPVQLRCGDQLPLDSIPHCPGDPIDMNMPKGDEDESPDDPDKSKGDQDESPDDPDKPKGDQDESPVGAKRDSEPEIPVVTIAMSSGLAACVLLFTVVCAIVMYRRHRKRQEGDEAFRASVRPGRNIGQSVRSHDEHIYEDISDSPHRASIYDNPVYDTCSASGGAEGGYVYAKSIDVPFPGINNMGNSMVANEYLDLPPPYTPSVHYHK